MNTAFVYSTNWSPGFHIGAARIFLLNWLTAAKTGGRVSVICDDVAVPSNRTDATIQDMIGWLISGSEIGYCGPYYNIHSGWDYDQAIETLLSQGWAYYDFATTEEIHQERLGTPIDKPFIYSRRFAANDEKDYAKFESEGRKPVVRLKMPRNTERHIREERFVFPDTLHGSTEYDLSKEHDYVVRQANGRHTSYLMLPINYRLRNVDFLFADWGHKQSVPAQLFIASRLGFKMPQMAHVPFLMEPCGRRRFSDRQHRRHAEDQSFSLVCNQAERIASEVPTVSDYGPLSPCYLSFYRRIGFLPATLRHYLAGTAAKDESWLTLASPFLDSTHLLQMFSYSNVKSTPSHFNISALWEMQKRYMANCDLKTKCWLVNDFLLVTKMSDYWCHDYEGGEPPEQLKHLVQSLDPWLVCAGDVLTLSDHYDEALKVRQ